MPNFTLKLGAVDLSPYVRVNPQDAQTDPYPAFLEPSFSDAPFADGDPLTSVSVKNREMSWPLYLHGAGNTKDQLHTLVSQINQEIAKAGTLTLEWKDAGATSSTFYDVVFARFDASYNFRASEKGWAAGVLHVWVAGYGHTGTTRLMGTAAGTGALLVAPIPSLLLGDGNAFQEMRMFTGSAIGGVNGRIGGMAVLPHPSYAAVIPAASFVQGGLSLLGASGAHASQLLSLGTADQKLTINIGPASIYIGRNRVLGLARTVREDGYCLRLSDHFGAPVGPTVMATAQDWALVDLGVFSVPTSPAFPTMSLTLRTGFRSWLVAGPHRGQFGVDYGAITVGGAGQLSALLVLPEDRLSLINDDPRQPLAFDSFESPVPASGALIGRTETLGNVWATPTMTSGPAYNAPFVSAANYNSAWAEATGAAWHGARLELVTPVADLAMRMRCQVVNGLASMIVMARKEISGSQIMDARVAYINPTQGNVSILAIDGTATRVVASAAVNLTQGADSGQGELLLESFHAGPVATLRLEQVISGNVTFISGSDALAAMPGKPAMIMNAPTAIGFAAQPRVWDFTAYSRPSQSFGAADALIFDGVNNAVFAATGASYSATSGTPLRMLTSRQRGAIPRLFPSAPAVAIFELPIGGGPANDLLSTEIRVRERFFYAR